MTFYASADKIDQVEYARENAVQMLDYMEDFFNITYPLPKAGKHLYVRQHKTNWVRINSYS